MESRREGRKDTFVLGDEAEERRTPRIESDDVEQIQRREIAALEQVRTERHSTADVMGDDVGTRDFPMVHELGQTTTLGDEINGGGRLGEGIARRLCRRFEGSAM